MFTIILNECETPEKRDEIEIIKFLMKIQKTVIQDFILCWYDILYKYIYSQ